jgi:glycerol-3-phosphate acyltransferase PlsY
VLIPLVLAPVLAVWLLVVLLSGYVGLATLTAAVAAPAAIAWMARPAPASLLVFSLAMAVFIVWTHRSNIARMRAGTENRVRRMWLLRPPDLPR